MFIIMLHYKKPIEMVDQYLAEHRTFLDEGYKKNYFIASGPRNPRTGGVILSQLTDRQKLKEFLDQDPFCLNGVAEYEYIEFTPVKYHDKFLPYIEGSK